MITMEDVRAVEVAPVSHEFPSDGGLCPACALIEYPEFDGWMVVGEGVVRGQALQADMWRYVLVSHRGLRHLDVTTEFLVTVNNGHNVALRKLVSAP